MRPLRAGALCRILNRSEVRQLMHDDLWLCLEHRRRQRLCVEDVDHHRARAELTNELGIVRRAPSLRTNSELSGERVVPQTEWPWVSRRGVSRRPMTPAAPARKTRLMKFYLLRSARGPGSPPARRARPSDADLQRRIAAHREGDGSAPATGVVFEGIFQWTSSLTTPLDSLSSDLSGNFRTVHSPVPEMPANFPVPATNVSIPPSAVLRSYVAMILSPSLSVKVQAPCSCARAFPASS